MTRYDQELDERGTLENLRAEIADAHSNGRAHYTETPPAPADELKRLRAEVDHLRRCLRQQDLIHGLTHDVDTLASYIQIITERGSMEHLRAEAIRDRISLFRTEWTNAGGKEVK